MAIKYRGTTCVHCGNHFVGTVDAMIDRDCGCGQTETIVDSLACIDYVESGRLATLLARNPVGYSRSERLAKDRCYR